MRASGSLRRAPRASIFRPRGSFRHPFLLAVSKRLRFRISFNAALFAVLSTLFVVFGLYFYFEYHLNKAMRVEKIFDRKQQVDSLNKDNASPFVVSPDVCEYLISKPMVCAHGGDVEDAPPNTIASYELAIEAEVECVEIDVSRTLDDILVVLHDRDLQAFSGFHPNVRVGDLTFAEILAMDAGKNHKNKRFKGQKVLTFESALKILGTRVKQIIVDIKIGPPKFEIDLVSDILSTISKVNCFDCLLWSKSDTVVRKIKEINPKMKTGFVVMKSSDNPLMSDHSRMNETEVVGIYHELVNSRVASDILKSKKGYAWTVDDVAAIHRMIDLQMDAIVSNKPKLVQSSISKRKQACIRQGYPIRP